MPVCAEAVGILDVLTLDAETGLGHSREQGDNGNKAELFQAAGNGKCSSPSEPVAALCQQPWQPDSIDFSSEGVQ